LIIYDTPPLTTVATGGPMVKGPPTLLTAYMDQFNNAEVKERPSIAGWPTSAKNNFPPDN